MSHPQKCIAFSALASVGVDAELGLIRGVSAISVGPALGHGRKVDQRSLETVLACAEKFRGGVRVVNRHTDNVLETVGLATNWRIDGNALRCDIELLQSNPDVRAKILELAERAPDTFGLSITFYDQPEKLGDSYFVRCQKLLDVAIVDEPAANASGLYGTFSAVSGTTQIQAMTYTPEEMASKIDALSAAVAKLTEQVGGIQNPDTEDMQKELSALRSEVDTLKSTVAKEVVSFGSRASALEQQLAPKDNRPAELVNFAAKVEEIRKANPKLPANAAIARAASADRKGHAAWLKAGQPNL